MCSYNHVSAHHIDFTHVVSHPCCVLNQTWNVALKFHLLKVFIFSENMLWNLQILKIVDRGSSVGTATPYGLDGPEIESRWGPRFSAPVQTGPVTHPSSYTMGSGSFPGIKRPERFVELPPPSSAEVMERVEPYIYSPSGSSWPVLGWTLTFTVTSTKPEKPLLFPPFQHFGKFLIFLGGY